MEVETGVTWPFVKEVVRSPYGGTIIETLPLIIMGRKMWDGTVLTSISTAALSPGSIPEESPQGVKFFKVV
tara:strand:- start:157 stop:369 length:213 start_codon:yes stop_codon:yes gene_type:complete